MKGFRVFNIQYAYPDLFSVMSKCSVELYMKVGTLLPELSSHEKNIDHYIELLRKDQVSNVFLFCNVMQCSY